MIESGRIFGGDSGFAYLGTIETDAHRVRGRLRVLRHDPDIESMYGRNENDFELTFAGSRVTDDRIEGELHRPGIRRRGCS